MYICVHILYVYVYIYIYRALLRDATPPRPTRLCPGSGRGPRPPRPRRPPYLCRGFPL